MMERLASALGIDTTELFYRELTSKDTIKTYRKAAIADIQGAFLRIIEEKMEKLDKDP
jgi:hypothetical protein